jgi:hypothetical protein
VIGRLAAALLASLLALFLPGPAGAQSIHMDIEVRFDPQSGEVALVELLQVSGEAVATFRLPPELSLKSMKIDGPGSRLSREDGVWTLRFEGAIDHRMALVFGGVLAAPGESGGGAVSGPVSGPEGSYLPSFGGWYPDFGDDPFTYTLAIDVPEGQRAVAPGRLVGETAEEGRYRVRFEADWPAEDMTVMAGPYMIDEKPHGDIILRSYFHPEIADLSAPYLDASAGYLDRYEALIGDYPYPAFSVVSSPLPVGLGFAGIAYMGKRVLRLPFIRGRSLGHEVLHNWWGNGVFVDYEGGNWAEGLTTFMADYAYAEDAGDNGGDDLSRAMRLRWLTDFAALPAQSDAPVRAFAGRVRGASQVTGYDKAAMLFVMLRDEIGAGVFNDGIRRFWRDNRFKRADWGDLREAFEAASGRGLKPFFSQWLDRTGAPKLRIKSVKAASTDTGYRVGFTLIQEAPAYSLSVPVVVETEAGPREFRVPLDDRIERYSLDLEARPTALEIDPDARLFRRLDPGEVPLVLRHVMLAPKITLTVASDDPAMTAAAETLVDRLVEGEVEKVARFSALLFDRPLVIVGSGLKLGRALAAAELPARPESPDGKFAGRGELRVWTTRSPRGFPVIVIEAESPEALEAVTRRLPHYGAKSYLLFDAGELVTSGIWPPGANPLRVELP